MNLPLGSRLRSGPSGSAAAPAASAGAALCALSVLAAVFGLVSAPGCGRRPMHPPFFTCNPFDHTPCPADMECRLVEFIYLCVEKPEEPLPDCEPEGSVRCNATGAGVELCADGRWEMEIMCGGDVPYCVEGECYMCPKGTLYCRGADVWQCAEAGDSTHHVEACDEASGEICHDGRCVHGCSWATDQGSHLGCRFLAVPTANPLLDSAFLTDFGIAVHNPNTSPATVQVLESGQVAASADLDPSQSLMLTAEMDPELKQDRANLGSVLLDRGAYEVRSSIPVAVFQFNPASGRVGRRCLDSSASSPCPARTSGATLLLPDHLLSTQYHVLTLGSAKTDEGSGPEIMPGFFAVTPAQDQTRVDVTFSAHTCAGPGLQSFQPGQSAEFTLSRGQVLQILSTVEDPPVGPTDLSGTIIQADLRVAVFAGHACAMAGPGTTPCGRLEEQLPPADLAGREHVLAPMAPTSIADPPSNLFRIISLSEGNTLSFDPPAVHAQATVGKGSLLDVTASVPFHVHSTGPVQAAQFVPHTGWPQEETGAPSFVMAVPVSQYAASHSFHLPVETAGVMYAIIAPFEQVSMVLDGQELQADRIERAGGSPYAVHWGEVNTDYTATGHYLTAGLPVGLVLYGGYRDASWAFGPGLGATD